MEIPFKPFTILAIGPFCPVPQDAYHVKIVPVDTPRKALAILRPALWIPVPKEICPQGGVTISPESLKDLSPDGMLASVPYIRDLNDARAFIRKSTSAGMSPSEIANAVRDKWPTISVDLSVQDQAPSVRDHNRVDDILSMVAMGEEHSARGAAAGQGGPAAWIAAIDGTLAALMRAIFSDETFRAFEAAWRGVEILVKQGPAGDAKETRLSLVSAERDNLVEALDTLAREFETDPPELVLIDMSFDISPVSLTRLEAASAFAESILVPTVVCASPAFLGLNDWGELDRIAYLAHHIEGNPLYAKWNKLRTLPQARWLVAACNGFLARPAYGKESAPRDVFFEESSPPWISPAWAVGTLAAQSAGRFGWPSRLTDGQSIRLEGLALHASQAGSAASTQAVFSVDRLRQFGEIGIAALGGVAMKDIALLPSAFTLSGESLSFQMFFSRLTAFLIRLREAQGSSVPDDASPWLEDALETFFRLSGGHLPGDLSVKAREEQGRFIFEITLTPPAAIIPGGRRITFSFSW